jgi:BirA family biotin operon repressor/biotin-[acetyl-CoA-carboxylase] ligase
MFERILKYQAVSSTQDIARRLVDRKKPVAIYALCQRHGRGRSSRAWFSPPGGLYLSLVVFPGARASSIPLLAALVVIRVLEDHGLSGLVIHWPNDVMINSRKVCGILCEEHNQAVICGIGLNVNTEKFPKNLAGATSMMMETGKEYNLNDIGQSIVNRFERLYAKIRSPRSIGRYIQRYVTGIGEAVEIITNARKYSGSVIGVDDDWALLFRDDNGVIRKFYYGDVRRLRW